MLNLRKSSKDKHTVGWFKPPDGRCKKHSKHKQSPGVCSLCLREKLSRLSLPITSSTASSYSLASTSCASSLSCSSSSACSRASPINIFPFTTESKSSNSSSFSSIFFLNGKHGIIKSRSMAVGTKKGGFWSRLLNPTKIVEEIH